MHAKRHLEVFENKWEGVRGGNVEFTRLMRTENLVNSLARLAKFESVLADVQLLDAKIQC
jgi:hypothetical protein